MKKIKETMIREGCPKEETISRYIYNLVSDKERKEIEKHLSHCTFCMEELIFATRNQKQITNEKKWPFVPAQVQSNIIQLIKNRQKTQGNIFQIGLRFFHKQLEILNHNGILMPQPALAVRATQTADTTPKKALYKIIQEYRVEADLKKVSDKEIDVQIKINTLKDNALLKGICFTLCKMDANDKPGHILEETVRDGKVVFEAVESGEYLIKIVQDSKEIGSIQLNLKI